MKKKCALCDIEVVTYVEHEVNPFFGLGALLCFMVFGFLSFLILPVVFFLTKNAVHRCCKCLQKLGEKKCLGLPEDWSSPVSIVSLKLLIAPLHIRYGTSD